MDMDTHNAETEKLALNLVSHVIAPSRLLAVNAALAKQRAIFRLRSIPINNDEQLHSNLKVTSSSPSHITSYTPLEDEPVFPVSLPFPTPTPSTTPKKPTRDTIQRVNTLNLSQTTSLIRNLTSHVRELRDLKDLDRRLRLICDTEIEQGNEKVMSLRFTVLVGEDLEEVKLGDVDDGNVCGVVEEVEPEIDDDAIDNQAAVEEEQEMEDEVDGELISPVNEDNNSIDNSFASFDFNFPPRTSSSLATDLEHIFQANGIVHNKRSDSLGHSIRIDSLNHRNNHLQLSPLQPRAPPNSPEPKENSHDQRNSQESIGFSSIISDIHGRSKSHSHVHTQPQGVRNSYSASSFSIISRGSKSERYSPVTLDDRRDDEEEAEGDDDEAETSALFRPLRRTLTSASNKMKMKGKGGKSQSRCKPRFKIPYRQTQKSIQHHDQKNENHLPDPANATNGADGKDDDVHTGTSPLKKVLSSFLLSRQKSKADKLSEMKSWERGLRVWRMGMLNEEWWAEKAEKERVERIKGSVDSVGMGSGVGERGDGEGAKIGNRVSGEMRQGPGGASLYGRGNNGWVFDHEKHELGPLVDSGEWEKNDVENDEFGLGLGFDES